MTAITSIILSVLMGLSQNFAAYTGINNIQCNPAFVINIYRIVKGAYNAKTAVKTVKTAVETYYKVKATEEAFDTARSLLKDSEYTAQEKNKVTKNKHPAKTNNVYTNTKKKSCNKQCRQRVENWRKGFMPDNDTKQDDNKTSQKRKQRKMNKKNRRRQIAQIPMSERDNHDDRIRVAVMGEEDYLILY